MRANIQMNLGFIISIVEKEKDMQNYKFPIVDFLSNNNTVFVSSESEYQTFKNCLAKMGLEGILCGITWEEWLTIANLNNPQKSIRQLLFEYNNNKGITFWVSEKESTEWFEVSPLSVSDLH